MAKSDKSYRHRLISKIGAAIQPDGPMTAAQAEATIEALAFVLATVHLGKNQSGYSTEAVEDLALSVVTTLGKS